MVNNLILLYGAAQQIGKTTLSKELKTRKIINHIDSVALYIKEISLGIHDKVGYEKITKEEFFQTRKDEKILSRIFSERLSV